MSGPGHLVLADAIRRRAPAVAYDVGAGSGQFGLWLREVGFQGRIISLEPNPQAATLCSMAGAKDNEWNVCRFAASDRQTNATLHIAGNMWSSSLLPMLPAHVAAAPESAVRARTEVLTVRLDDLDMEMAPALLKLDVQGVELTVLRGAKRLIPSVTIAWVEMSVVPLYEGQALMAEVQQFLSDHGLVLQALEPAFRAKDGTVLQFDGLFERVVA